MSEWVRRWWRGEAGAAGTLLNVALTPAELAFRAAVRLRDMAYTHDTLHTIRVGVPVVSIGNIMIGGAGKTPFAAFIARRLAHAGHTPALLHGGYADDEPMLHRQWNPAIPVFVGRDRVASARRAASGGATVLILDDGFQHRRLVRDVDLVLVAAETWSPAPRLLPRGPWRESPAALARASAVVITERTTIPDELRAGIRREIQTAAPGVPICTAALRPAGWRRGSDAPGTSTTAPDAGVLAVAAIAQPELFVRGAQAAGAHVDELLAFRDHHAYTAQDARSIVARAGARPIVTTSKDWVKLSALLDGSRVWVLEQQVVIEDGAATLDALLSTLQAR